MVGAAGFPTSLRSLDCFRQPKIPHLWFVFLGRQVRTRCVLILAEIKKRLSKKENRFFGWGGGIRTHEMQESKSCALPLGDAPILSYSKNAHSLLNYGRRFLYGVEGGIRTHGLQSHNLTR